MACIDWPCCGHERGCCPDYDESGKQLNMRCVCGAVLPLNSPVSLCKACLRDVDDDEDTNWDDEDEDDTEDDDCYDDSMDGDHDSNMRDIGWGTDEDYGCYGDD